VNDSIAIDDEEFLYRKVSVNSGWYDPGRSELKPDAFKPRRVDTKGLSFDRAASPSHPGFRSLEQAALGQSPGGYYIAVFSVGGLRSSGFTVVADSLDENPGHALLTDLIYAKPRDSRTDDNMVQLAHQLVERVEGPFVSEKE